MKRFFLTISLLCSLAVLPQSVCAAPGSLEPKAAYKGVVNIIAYAPDGSVLRSGTGVFIDTDGTCAAAYSLLLGAAGADVIDYKGNKLTVHRILGANSTYDLVKFSTSGGKKIEAFALASTPDFSEGTTLSLLHYTTNKKQQPIETAVVKADDYDEYKYLRITAANSDTNFGCPLTDAEGRLVAFVQQSVEKGDSTSCAIDARFLNDLAINTMSAMNSDLRALLIPKALPAVESDALTYIYMMNTADSVMTMTALNDFIAAYPDNAEGYTNRGKFYAEKQQYALCEQDFATALEKAISEKSTVKADEVHNDLSKLIFHKAAYTPNPPYADWNFERAYKEAEQAYALNPAPFYLLQQGRCLFANKQYSEAYEKFYQLATIDHSADDNSWSEQAQAENWFYAARSLELAGGDSLQVIALMDSAIAKSPTPYTASAAQYFLERAQRLQRVGEARKAVFDYNEYEKIIGPKNLNAQFYYIREQAELECRMYQQALDDIRTAILREPADPGYKIEEALILLRAGQFDEAIAVCTALLADYPEAADCHKILGIAHGELGHKAKAVTALTKAKELGDTTVDTFLEKYR